MKSHTKKPAKHIRYPRYIIEHGHIMDISGREYIFDIDDAESRRTIQGRPIARFLASGGYGDIYVARDGPTGEHVVVKVVKLASPKDLLAFKTEYHAHRYLSAQPACQPYILCLLNCDIKTGNDGISYGIFILPLMSGDLYEFATRSKKTPVMNLLEILHAGIEGLSQIHGKKFALRDIKPSNMLYKKDDHIIHVYLSDLGIACASGEHTLDPPLPPRCRAGGPATYEYLSPEICQHTIAKTHASFEEFMANDVWALGVTFHGILYQRLPFKLQEPGSCQEQAYMKQSDVNILPYYQALGPMSKENVTNLLIAMLQVDWRKRATMAQIREDFNKYFVTCQYYSIELTKSEMIDTILKVVNPRFPKDKQVKLSTLENLDIPSLCQKFNEICILKGRKGPLYFDTKQLQLIAEASGVSNASEWSKQDLCKVLYDMVTDRTDAAKMKNSNTLLTAVANAIYFNKPEFVEAMNDLVETNMELDIAYLKSRYAEDERIHNMTTDKKLKERLTNKWKILNKLIKQQSAAATTHKMEDIIKLLEGMNI